MPALKHAPEGDIFSVFDNVSDAVFVIDREGACVYNNARAEDFPAHLLKRATEMCAVDQCACDQTSNRHIAEQSMLESWEVSCSPLGKNMVLVCRLDNSLRDRVLQIREAFTDALASNMPAKLAAMKVLREHIDSRWITIGEFDWPNERILFEQCYDGDVQRQDLMPALYRNPDFNVCGGPAIAQNPADCFNRTAAHRLMGVKHIIGLPLKNHKKECVGYALLADDKVPDNVSQTVTLLQELGALYGPYFEAGTARKQAEQAIVDANTDVVTGMGNRRAFETFLEQCLDISRQEAESDSVAAMFDIKAMRNSMLMLVDFDGFKRLNDTMGHDEGDRALRLVSDALSDSGGEGSKVFRLGGDELVQIFPRSGDLDSEDLRIRLNKIEKSAHEAGFIGLGLSMGAVHFFEGDGSQTSLMTMADARMYHEKRMRAIDFV